jgi:hypothetical protein
VKMAIAAKSGWLRNSEQAACLTKRFREVGFRLFYQHKLEACATFVKSNRILRQ